MGGAPAVWCSKNAESNAEWASAVLKLLDVISLNLTAEFPTPRSEENKSSMTSWANSFSNIFCLLSVGANFKFTFSKDKSSCSLDCSTSFWSGTGVEKSMRSSREKISSECLSNPSPFGVGTRISTETSSRSFECLSKMTVRF